MNDKEIGVLLLQLRKERGQTQSQLATALHVSAQAVSKWERGLGCPDVSLLPALAGIFGVSMERLLAGDLAPTRLRWRQYEDDCVFNVFPDCGNILNVHRWR